MVIPSRDNYDEETIAVILKFQRGQIGYQNNVIILKFNLNNIK